MTQEEFFSRYKYSIRTDKIGGGAFGTVYRAFDEELNREVAIKVSEVKVMGGKEFSLKDEFDAIRDVPVQRNIANYESLHTFESPQGVFDYAIMQFYKDGNLSSFIKGKSTFAQKEQVALDLLEGINHLHKYHIVHRDLKPGNILIVKRGDKIIPVITDFGLSKHAEMEGQSRFSNSFGGGTLKYSSPEQLKAEKLRLNTDLWAYGVIVHEIFTGKNLFMAQGITGASAEAEKEIYEQIIGVDISEMIKELPSKWQSIVAQCLVRDGAKRIKSAEALKELIIKGKENLQVAQLEIDVEPRTSDGREEVFVDDETMIDIGQAAQNEESKKEIRKKKKQPKKEESRKKKTLIGVGIMVLVLLISGFSYSMFPSESNDWEQAQEINTEQSYKIFIEKNPYGEFLDLAKDNLGWQIALNSNSIDAIDTYLNEYSNGAHASNARITLKTLKELETDRLETKEWEKLKNSNTIKSYGKYIESYPNGKYTVEAKSKIVKIENNPVFQNKQGDVFWDQGQFTKAFKLYSKSAEQGNVESMYSLANMYAMGNGVERNNDKNMYWLNKSVETEDAGAMFMMGFTYEYGWGMVEKDVEVALYWYKKSASKGNAKGQGALASMYKKGKGVKTNLKTAAMWYQRVVDQGPKKGENDFDYALENLRELGIK